MEVLGSSAAAPELHVLAVDDSYVDRKVVERLLKISACKVTTVESGRRALQYLGLDGEDNGSVDFEAVKVNLILTDYSMPGMTGYELLKKIKGSSALKQIPVVIMSSENIVTRIDRCLEEGAEEFLMKPVKLSDVKRIKNFMLRSDEEDDKKRVNLKRKLSEEPIKDLKLSSEEKDYQKSEISEEPSSTAEPRLTQSCIPSDLAAPDSLVKRPRLLATDGEL